MGINPDNDSDENIPTKVTDEQHRPEEGAEMQAVWRAPSE